MAAASTSHQWRFFRAGGFDQVKIETGADMVHLDELDQKLWVALACPVSGLDFDARTAALIDTDKDGRIRAAELIAAAKWAGAMLKNPDLLIQGGDTLALDAINDNADEGKQLLAAARHVLDTLGQAGAKSINLAQAMDGDAIMAKAPLNGDGVVTADSTANPALRALVNEIIECAGAMPDRSGQPGINQERADQFFTDAAAFDAWMKEGEAGGLVIFPLGAATADAAQAVKAVKSKIDDYFGRCRLAGFEPRLASQLNGKEEDYLAAAARPLSFDGAELAAFPLARPMAGKPLPLGDGINPAYAAAMATLRAQALTLLPSARTELTENNWLALQAKLEPYEKWQAAKQGAAVEKLGMARVRELLAGPLRVKLNALIAQDASYAGAAAAMGDLEKLLRYVRDLRRLCRNFVNFKDLYGGQTHAIFQAGVLFLDRRSCLLCLTVEDAGRHAVMAGLSGAYLAYCDCARKGTNEKLSIVAIFSQGDDDNLMAGRNGVFYDRQGRDYDATITKIVSSPISLRQAFWAPYKKFARMIEEHVAKKASASEADVNTQLSAAANLANAPAAPATGAAAPSAKPAFDPSVIALVSLALGALAAAFGSVLLFLGKFPKSELPLVLLGIMVLISLPSLTLAYIKLRKRNLGPILDANGWAINAKASINVPFGVRLTEVAQLPPGASLDTRDRYAQHAAVWPKFLAALFVILWIFAILHDTGLLTLWTQKWRDHSKDTGTNTPPAAVFTGNPGSNAPPATNVTAPVSH